MLTDVTHNFELFSDRHDERFESVAYSIWRETIRANDVLEAARTRLQIELSQEPIGREYRPCDTILELYRKQ